MSPYVYIPLNLILPGLGDIVSGPPYRKGGVYTLLTFLSGIPLMVAFGLGFFVMGLVWISCAYTSIARAIRSKRA